MIEQIQCRKCLAIKAVAEFSNGRVVCKVCRKEQDRKYYAANREQINEQQRNYRSENHEQINEKNRKYYAANREYYRNYKAANREQIREQNRKYNAENREQINQQTLIRSLDPAKLAELKTKLEKL